MKIQETKLKNVFEIQLSPISDDRGWFARTFCANEFSQIGFKKTFVQMNQSFNEKMGTFRGLHYQVPPHAETKLIRCITGGVIDIIVDLRAKSPTFLQSIQLELSAKNNKMVLIPEGCAHGFITLEPNSSLIYHHTEFYHPESDRGVRIDDPRLAIQLREKIQVISTKDQSYPFLDQSFTGVPV